MFEILCFSLTKFKTTNKENKCKKKQQKPEFTDIRSGNFQTFARKLCM